MKKPLYWTIVTGWSAHGCKLMAVTSEKGSQIYGRDGDHGNPTHRRCTESIGRFPTEEAARAVVAGIESIRQEHERLREPLRKRIKELHRSERLAVESYIRDRR